MRRNDAPTLQNVADEAGVSVMMASVVLNGAQSSTRVAPATRARIVEVAGRLKYRRNAVAHGLSRKCMDTIGVTAVIDGGELNLYILEVINGVLEAAAQRGQNTMIFSVSNWRQDASKIPEFCDGRVDGMILIAPDFLSPELVSHHTPFVTIHANDSTPAARNLNIDNEAAAYTLTHHLIGLGHRHIVHFMGCSDVLGAQQRCAGYYRALEDAHIPFHADNVHHGSFSIASGRQRMEELLIAHCDKPLPTAIFCANDAIAYGCMEALESCGLQVPKDISVAGFDDTLMARMTKPALTTMRQPFRMMGRCAVERLLSLTTSRDERSSCEIGVQSRDPGLSANSLTEIFPCDLIVRESVGVPSASPVLPLQFLQNS